MAQRYPRLEPKHAAFITEQKMFFTASAAATGHVNLSPKGMDSFRILDANRACYLDLTGSGNETAAHSLADGRITIMFCAFEGAPLILRLYGQSTIHGRGTREYDDLLAAAFDGNETVGARQIVVIDFDLVQTSCGYAVPRYDFHEDRDTLVRWAEAKESKGGLAAYRHQKNRFSLDGLPTGLTEETSEPTLL